MSNTPNANELNTRPVWMDDPLVKDIAPEKLDFLGTLFKDGHGKNQKQLMSYIMPMMKKAKAQNLTFSPAEINACIQAIKKHSTPQELENIDKILNKKNEQP